MRKWILLTLLFSTAFAANKETGFWLQYFLFKQFDEKNRVEYWEQWRFADRMNRLQFWSFEAILYHSFSKYFEAGPAYRQAWTRDREGRINTVFLPYLASLISLDTKPGLFTARTRIEYRITSLERSHWVYRERFQWELPLGEKFTPFISDEIFIGREEGFNENRFIVGMAFNLFEGFSFVPQYLRRTQTGFQSKILIVNFSASF